jgi:hypothetical protein
VGISRERDMEGIMKYTGFCKFPRTLFENLTFFYFLILHRKLNDEIDFSTELSTV